MIELKEGVYYLANWFTPINLLGTTGDMMGIVYKEGDKGDATIPWKITYRFRWHRDDKVFDSTDIKNWYKGELDGSLTEDEVEQKVRGRLESKIHSFDLTWNRIRGDHMAALVAITGDECAHVKTGKDAKEYAKKHGLMEKQDAPEL